jgi:Flp pilus assembly protein CpaB
MPVTVAARPIASGAVLTADDLTVQDWPVVLDSPAPAMAVGSVVRGPVAAGEPITRTRLVPGGGVAPPAGTVVVPLTLGDDRVASLLQSGDRVDVLVTPDSLHEGDPRTAATDVEVLGVPAVDTGAFAGPESGAVVLLAVPAGVAGDLAAIRRSDHVTVAIR